MLILTRKASEKIIIDDNTNNGLITITVTNVKGGQVRLGIEARDDISVHREEIYNKIKEEKSKERDLGVEAELSMPSSEEPCKA